MRSRLDWKYALSLELTDPGFDHTVLCEFRTRLVALSAEERFLEAVLDLCKQRGWLKARGRQRTDSTHVLAKVRAINRTECVVETLRHALNVLAVVAPDWLRSQVQPEWLERYGPRASEYRFPSGTDKRLQFEHQVGQDGWGLLAAIKADSQSQWMLSIPAIDTLQRVWKQDYLPLQDGGTWVAEQDRLEAAKLFYSPYDLDASAAKKRSTFGLAIKCISRKPVMKNCHGSLRTSPQILGQCQIERLFQRSMLLYSNRRSSKLSLAMPPVGLVPCVLNVRSQDSEPSRCGGVRRIWH